MKTRTQKSEIIESSVKLLENHGSLVFADFSGIPVSSINELKNRLKKVGGKYVAIKKRLFRVALQKTGHEFDPTQFEAQLGVVFVPGELTEAASTVYMFSRELAKNQLDFKVLGAYEISEKRFLTAEEFTVIAKLPTREQLLGMVVGVLAGPIRGFMHVVSELSKRPESAPQEAAVQAS
ncbi:MAG: 50S ribosomal protein L10 [Candidatus Harrisonbacteria bacterium CG10_big_fil_rev_8_21_14_0_10_40_38]|uniref:Large ribosomal subunit protein uL10 n=1 Tax=Candidatus Harrisonbacteria bacterium CG10_big_fil_rev_8_21_14_0_10_40_38 TaxID=1974583 RepID=A0A2H0USZ8_9BACT|nr:MAG: 50S ribosomal protein L10 [Candidatus Harrisonbacteria bacterium CG10_big_fil_rev_8_21_14_0_10_40_38]